MDTNRKEAAPARYFEFDVVKTLSIVFMICVHVYENMTEIDWLGIPPTGFLRNLIEFLGGPVAAPAFMFAMGVGMICTRHSSPSEFIRRGIRLLLGGLVLNFFRQTILLLISQAIGVEYHSKYTVLESILISDVLPFAGLSFILTGVLKKLRVQPFIMLILSILMQMAGSLLTTNITPPTIPSTLLGFFVFTGNSSCFPLLLWYVYPAAGMVFAGILKGTEDRGPLYRKLLVLSAVILASLSCCLVQNGYDLRKMYMLADQSYYIQSLFHTLFSLSVQFIILSLAYFAFRSVSEQSRPMQLFRWCGTNLNRIYVFQWLLIPYTIAVMTLLETDMLPLSLVIPVGLVFSLAAAGLCAAWNRLRRRKQKA